MRLKRCAIAGYQTMDVSRLFRCMPGPRNGGQKFKGGMFSFIGGVTVTRGMLMIWYHECLRLSIPVGGNPMFSPFSAFPPSYELTILSVFGALFGMLFLNRLPGAHPLFETPAVCSLASHDRFFSS